MKRKQSIIGLALIFTLLLSTVAFANESVGAGAVAEQEEFTLEEMLEYALQDERLAQAEYATIMDTFDVTRPFSNIEKAEIKHEAAVIGLYEARDLDIPTFDPESYVIIPDTLNETYEIGVQAEINNIAMYEKFLLQVLDDDVRLIFEALRDGSISHLEAFQKQLERNNGQAKGQSSKFTNRQMSISKNKSANNNGDCLLD